MTAPAFKVVAQLRPKHLATFQRMATAYGTELGIRRESLIAAILIVQFVGVPATFLFGALAQWMGAKRSIFAGLLVYLGVSVVAYFMKTGSAGVSARPQFSIPAERPAEPPTTTNSGQSPSCPSDA